MDNIKIETTLNNNISLLHLKIAYLEILEMNQEDLQDYIKEEFQNNPLINLNENYKSLTFYSISNSYHQKDDTDEKFKNLNNIPIYDENIETEILYQLDLRNYTNKQIDIIKFLISLLDSKGFLKADIQEIEKFSKYSIDEIEYILNDLKQLKPIGIFSKNYSENYIFQLKKNNTININEEKILKFYLKDLLLKKFTKIKKNTGENLNIIINLYKKIINLSPYPLFNYKIEKTQYIIADILVQRIDNNWVVNLNDKFIDTYTFDEYYMNMLSKTNDKDIKKYLLENMKKAKLIIDSINLRRNTIIDITKIILRYQNDYFLNNGSLKPMKLSDISDELNINVSTVSRAIKNKYIQYKNVILLKDLFSNSVSDEGKSQSDIKLIIKKIIDEEDKNKPLSDIEISNILKNKNINISRRTVTKYRKFLNILSSKQRRYIK